MQAFLVSTGIVALAEIGDKTQLLSILLAVRFRKPAPIILGIFFSTLVNHACAGGAAGQQVRLAHADPTVVHRIAALIFLVLGLLALQGVGK